MTSQPRTRTVLITGCTPGGIGHSLIHAFHSAPYNYHIFATARDISTLSSLSSTPGITLLPLDVTSETSVAAAAAQVSAQTNGTLDILVNNAGRSYPVPAVEVDLAEARAMFETNVLGVMAVCGAFAPLLVKAAASSTSNTKRDPVIIQIGSVGGVVPYVFGAAYNASKAALHSYSDCLRLELSPFGVRVVTVITGGVQSRIASRGLHRLKPNSLYEPIEDAYVYRQTYSQSSAAKSMPSEEYAASVVRQVLARSEGQREIWEGGRAWLVWFATRFLPRWVVEAYMMREFGLWRLKRGGGGGKQDNGGGN